MSSNRIDGRWPSGIHVVNGDSAAGCLLRATGIPRQQMVVNRDPVECGPVPSNVDWRSWGKARAGFLAAISGDEGLPVDFYRQAGEASARLLDQATSASLIYIWAGRSLADQLLIARMCELVSMRRTEASRIRAVQYDVDESGSPIFAIAELSPESIRRYLPEPKALGSTNAAAYRLAWSAYSNGDRSELQQYPSRADCPEPLREAMAALRNRFPDPRSGLTGVDRLLLDHARRYGPKVSRVIGYTAAIRDNPDQLGDGYLYWRIRQLASPASSPPLLALTGDPTKIRTSSVELTSLGERVLAGLSKAEGVYGGDDWVGGVCIGSGQ